MDKLIFGEELVINAISSVVYCPYPSETTNVYSSMPKSLSSRGGGNSVPSIPPASAPDITVSEALEAAFRYKKLSETEE